MCEFLGLSTSFSLSSSSSDRSILVIVRVPRGGVEIGGEVVN